MTPEAVVLRERLVRVITRGVGSSTVRVPWPRRRAGHTTNYAVFAPLISSAGVQALSGRAFDLAQREYPADERRGGRAPGRAVRRGDSVAGEAGPSGSGRRRGGPVRDVRRTAHRADRGATHDAVPGKGVARRIFRRTAEGKEGMTDKVSIRHFRPPFRGSTRSWAVVCRSSPSISSSARPARARPHSRTRSCSRWPPGAARRVLHGRRRASSEDAALPAAV